MDVETGISVVIPCLNEEESVGKVVEAALRGIEATNLPGEVIVVDNLSTDRSAEVAAKAGARVVREAKPGYGVTLRKGFGAARYSILIMGDADLTYDMTRLADLIAPILRGRADFVMGNRMSGIRPGAMPALNRYIGNPALSMMLRILFDCKTIDDSQCGLRAIRKEAYQRLNCVTTGMEFASEMIIRAIAAKLTITERDIEYHPRMGESKLRPLRDAWRHVRFMLLCSPSIALFLPSSFCWALSLIPVVFLAIGPIQIRYQQFDVNSMLLLGLLNIVSMQLMTGGMVAKAYAHLSGFRQDPFVVWVYKHLSFKLGAWVSAILLGLGAVIVLVEILGPWPLAPGNTDAARLMVFSVICMVNGVQLWVTCYLLSVMALPRHLDAVPPAVEDTATRDV